MNYRLLSLVVGSLCLQGCVGNYSSPYNGNVTAEKSGSQAAGGRGGNYVFRNTVYFKNVTPYCVAVVASGETPRPAYRKKLFNPVKKSITLQYGGGEAYVDYNFNLNNQYRTMVKWYSLDRRYLNTEYIGSLDFNDSYRYNVKQRNFGEQYLTLSNKQTRECWVKPPELILKRR